VQFCVDPGDNGALSSCPAGEGHTWGKVSAESVASGSVYVHADVTAVFPWVTYALLSDPKMKRKPRRLYDARGRAVAALQREVDKRRKALALSTEYPLVDRKPRRGAVADDDVDRKPRRGAVADDDVDRKPRRG